MTGASPETKVDALREAIKEATGYILTGPQIDLTMRPVAQHITLAEQAAYERAAQRCIDNSECPKGLSACHEADAEGIRELARETGSASALELALAQAESKEAEWWAEDCVASKHLGITEQRRRRIAQKRARIADLSGEGRSK